MFVIFRSDTASYAAPWCAPPRVPPNVKGQMTWQLEDECRAMPVADGGMRLVPHIFASIVATAGIHLIIVLRTRHHRAQHRTYWQMTRTPTPQLPISKVTRRSHHLPRSSVSRRHGIVTITEESGEKHKEPRGVSLQRNHRRNSLLMGGPSTDFACRTFPLILLACERTIGCTDALPV